ncbi:MAG: HlyD family type I secretion periplasmic adaptor subunit [Gammaproteobacteria bacterium]|jgi:HlyD family type I secretion membrane fusion protein|nr:HlyD family type I secretion periplasmic adaptor subunit [Gammaproteobacteria bacterium]
MANNFSTQVCSHHIDSVDDGLGIKVPVTTGIFIIILFFGMFGVWATIVPLESAAIAPGVVSVDSKRKTIQHLEGGIIGAILIQEGDEVEAGETLIHLDETQARANLDLLKSRFLNARALEARLLAERDNKENIDYPDELIEQQQNEDVAQVIEGQVNIFNARRQALLGQIAITEQQIKQLKEEIQGLNGLTQAQDEQLKLSKDEISSNKKLFEKRLAGKARLRKLQRERAEVNGERSQNLAAIARGRQKIDEARLQITELKTKALNEVVRQLGKVQSNLFDLIEKVRAAQDVLTRTVISAPLDGTIVNLQVHTVGGVIAPGQDLMDIVPLGARLIVEARVAPDDIDVVRAGLKAQVRLTAFNQRRILPIDGQVITVSADRFTDERSGAGYFLARVELVGEIDEEIELYPGMQAAVMIVTGSRTTLDYLIRPITQSFNRAFREK